MMRESIIDMIDDELDMNGDITIGGITFAPSYILKQLDPIAYRELASNLIDSMLEDLQYDLDRVDPEVDPDEYADIQDKISELEEFTV